MVPQPTIDPKEVEHLRRRLAAAEQELDSYRARLRRQLNLAAEVHRSLLPKPVHDDRILIDARYVPIEEIGGDYCQVHSPDPESYYVTVCDVTGHGLGPALLATRVTSEVRSAMVYGLPPREILRWLNRFILENFSEANLYLSLVAAQIHLPRRRITWSGAGHPSPLLVRRNEPKVELLVSQNPLVGVFKSILADEPEHSAELAPGDRVVFYSDGLTETADEDGRQLGTEGLSRIAIDAMGVGLFEMADFILDRVAQHNYGPITDDKTLIVAEIR